MLAANEQQPFKTHDLEALAARHEGDYERVLGVGPEVSDIQIGRAAEFIKMVEDKLRAGVSGGASLRS